MEMVTMAGDEWSRQKRDAEMESDKEERWKVKRRIIGILCGSDKRNAGAEEGKKENGFLE